MSLRGNPPERNTPEEPGQDSYPPGPGPLLTQRTALILIAAFVIGIIAGVLTYLMTHRVAGAVLAGAGAFGTAVPVLHILIG